MGRRRPGRRRHCAATSSGCAGRWGPGGCADHGLRSRIPDSVQEPELDVLGFEAACRDAGAARRAIRWPEASVAAARALELWRGTPLLDVPRRCCAISSCPGWSRCGAGAGGPHRGRPAAGPPGRLIPRTAGPGGAASAARALPRAADAGAVPGRRQAEALAAYQHPRAALVEELGIEPGPSCSRLHQQILAGDPGLAAPPAHGGDAAAPGPAGRAPAPGCRGSCPPRWRTSPAGLAELEALAEMLDQAGGKAPGRW